MAGSVSNAPAYVPLSVGGNKCYGLVDSGAMVSLCTMEILGDQVSGLEKSELKVHGVTGNHLTVLGQKEIEINIGGSSVITSYILLIIWQTTCSY